MQKYNPNEFINKLDERMEGKELPSCPYCGGRKFTTTDSMASIFIGKELNSVTLGPSVPAGMIICEKCGHIEFFALGVLGLLPKKEESKDV